MSSAAVVCAVPLAELAHSLLESHHCMADWKQITARIRRARSGKDPAGQLTNLFSKTRDAMVAFELARYFESKGNTADAGRWYLTAAERFRRADWKTKAQECATRLGATEAADVPAGPAHEAEPPRSAPEVETRAEPEAQAESANSEQPAVAAEDVSQAPANSAPPPSASSDRQRQRRGRRGGRDPRQPRRGSHAQPPSRERERERQPQQTTVAHTDHEEAPESPVTSSRSSEQVSETPVAPSVRGRFGDPGLASRMTQLEMNFRRLLACPPCSISDAEKAPAGPGVWVLTDSDMSTYYYVEPCQTLRVAIPHLLRGSAARRGDSIKPRLAEHLGIPETRVAKYLADHCVVRWLQMDEDASHFAHFLIAVLHPELNE